MQGLADSAGAGVQFSNHAFDLFTQAQFVDVNTEHIGTSVQSLQAGEVLLASLDLQRSNDRLQLSQQRIGRGSKCVACIVDALQVTGIASM